MDALNCVPRALKSRWMMAVASFFILSFAGSNYIFGLYSETIKTTLAYSQENIDTLAFFKDLGANVGIIAGLVNELSAPWVVLIVGAAMNLTGYLMIWLSVTGRVAKPQIWQMYMYQCIGGSSMTFVNTGVIVTSVKNFPRGRGLVIGLLKGFVGLSGAIMTQIYEAVYGPDQPSSLIFLAATLPTTVVLVLMRIIRPMDSPKEKNEMKNFYIFIGMAVALAAFLMASILVENLLVLPHGVIRLFAAITVIIIFVPLVVVISSQRSLQKPESSRGSSYRDQDLSAFTDFEKKIELQRSREREDSVEISVVRTDLAAINQSCADTNAENKGIVQSVEKSDKPIQWPQRGEDHTVAQALMSADLWILFLATTCGLGSTITAIDNMGQIGKSLRYSQVTINTFVSLFSIWNFIGRIGSGCLSEYLLHKYCFPRPLLQSVVLAVASIGHLLIAFAFPGSIYVASVLIGMCFGAQWPILFSVISELFGLRPFAILYNVGASASPLGAYLFSVRVAGYLYDRKAKQEYESSVLTLHHNAMENKSLAAPSPALAMNSNDLMCLGKGCFQLTFLIMATISAVGCAIAAVLAYRTKHFYKQDMYGKFNCSGDGNSAEYNERSQPSIYKSTSTDD